MIAKFILKPYFFQVQAIEKNLSVLDVRKGYIILSLF